MSIKIKHVYARIVGARGRPRQGPAPGGASPRRGQAPPGAGPANVAGAKAPPGAGPGILAGAKAPPGAGRGPGGPGKSSRFLIFGG